MPKTANTRLFIALMALVVLAPLPFASQRPWAWSALAMGVGAICVCWAFLVALGKAQAASPLRRYAVVIALFALVLLWAMLQAMGLTPQSWYHPLWAERLNGGLPSAAVEAAGNGALSLDPERTWTGIMRLLTFGGVFWMAVQLCRDRARARIALLTICVATLVYAIYGLAVFFAGSETILWFDKWAYKGDLTATFVNRNAFGAFAGIGVVCSVALFAHGLRPRHGDHVYDRAQRLFSRALPFLAAAMVVGTALLLAHSRASFASTGIAVAVLLLALTTGEVLRPRVALAAIFVLLVVGGSTMMISGGDTLDRMLLVLEEGKQRSALYAVGSTALMDAPWTGFGLGTFEPVFRLYRDATMVEPLVFEFAHNIHLEAGMDLGIPVTLLYYTVFALIMGTCLRGLRRRRRDQIYPAVALAVTVLLGVHGLVDFSAQIPANAVLLALLLGIGHAQSFNTSRHGQGGRQSDREPAPASDPTAVSGRVKFPTMP